MRRNAIIHWGGMQGIRLRLMTYKSGSYALCIDGANRLRYNVTTLSAAATNFATSTGDTNGIWKKLSLPS